MNKEKVIALAKKHGIDVYFDCGEEALAFSINNEIHLRSNMEDYEEVFTHELLHFYENSKIFNEIASSLIESLKESNEYQDLINEYKLRYLGLYSKEEIEHGILDKEIVIDILANNSSKVIDGVNELTELILDREIEELKEKRYLETTLKNNINAMLIKKWDKIFCQSIYGREILGKKYNMPSGKDKIKIIEEDIDELLEKLYNYHDFNISINSKELLREYENKIKSFETNGEQQKKEKYLKHQNRILSEMAFNTSKILLEEYQNIVSTLQKNNYDKSFQVLMLLETLNKTYEINNDIENKIVHKINKRIINETISGHMNLNKTVLDIIYNNTNINDNFADIYFDALEELNKDIQKDNNFIISGLETYGKGKWLKFEGRLSNKEEYLENAKKLSSLVQNTPWCTKQAATSQLSNGDFYVFIDNDGRPHIAIKLSGNEIDEVRGIHNGHSQELEEEYRDVAISFLKESKNIPDGINWLNKEELNKRLIKYREEIETGELKEEEVPKLIEDIMKINYKNHNSLENSNLLALKKILYKIKNKIINYYKIKESQIELEDYNFENISDTDLIIILGSADFKNSKIINLKNIQIIGGDANFSNSQIISLGNLKKIRGNAIFENSKIKNLENLEIIGGNANFSNSQITYLGKLEIIGGTANFSNSIITDLGNLKIIGQHVIFSNSQITYLGKLEIIGGTADFRNSKIKSLGNLKYIEGSAYFSDSQITDLGNLSIINGYASFYYSKIKSLGNIKEILGAVDLRGTQIRDLGSLKLILGDVYLDSNYKIDIERLKEITKGRIYIDNKEIKNDNEVIIKK